MQNSKENNWKIFHIILLQAEKHTQILELACTEAQSLENQVHSLQQWIDDVDLKLNDFLNNDTTMDDLPDDFQVITDTHYLLITIISIYNPPNTQ